MVLCTPILLMVMALMVNIGTMACWRLRELGAARHSVWASRHPRSGAVRPPDWWPAGATMGTVGRGDITELDDPRIDHPVVRGPLPMGTIVNEDRLDPVEGFRQGKASLTRDFPMLARMGPYHMEAGVRILDREWQHREMGLWSTWERRIPAIYMLPQADMSYVDAYIQAVIEIIYAPFRPDLAPLDRDEEFIEYSARFAGSATFPYAGAPDFHPALSLTCGGSCRSGCDPSPDYVSARVERLIDRIRGTPEQSLAYRMAGAFINLYKAVQRELERQIAALQAGESPPAGQIGALQTEIDELQKKIDAMQQFKDSLPH
jgi:hypothetical protein